MNKVIPFLSFLAIAIASSTLTLYISNLVRDDDPSHPVSHIDGFITNQSYIRDLHEPIDLDDPDEVFRYVFNKLDDEILLYPTEYYYFTFPANGKVIWGSMHLPAYKLDEGVLGFGYIEKGYDVHQTARVGGSADYISGDAIKIEKINDFSYSITFEEKAVLFKLNELKLDLPQKARLTSDEVLVEPTFDESGLPFFLVFNEVTNRLYWLLNEEGYVPETFKKHGENLVVGNRTGFAFYLDEENNRKLLIGVYAINVMRNNWFDGPFDQLLDNYVRIGQVDLKEYIEAHDPTTAGEIGEYGNYLESEGMRVAIAPYSVYFYEEDLKSVITSCNGSETRNEFYACLTQENHDSLLDPPYP
jgi:hypothetical protein